MSSPHRLDSSPPEETRQVTAAGLGPSGSPLSQSSAHHTFSLLSHDTAPACQGSMLRDFQFLVQSLVSQTIVPEYESELLVHRKQCACPGTSLPSRLPEVVVHPGRIQPPLPAGGPEP